MQTKTQTSSLFPEDFAHSPDKECFKGILGRGKRAFTLVELIIVITILAILATIAFVSYQGYSSQSRDANRVSTVKNIENGVNVFFTKTSKVPEVDDFIGTGILNSVSLNLVGKVGKGIARVINLNEVPSDPRAGEQYWYGTDVLRRYYQVGLTLELESAYTLGREISYAGTIREAKVQGNYEYPLKIGNMVYSLPSLLYLGSGALNDTTRFIVDKGNNVPYTFGGENTGTQSVSEVLKIITGTGKLSLTGVNLPSDVSSSTYKTADGIPSAFSGVMKAIGISEKTKLGIITYGKDYIEGNSVGNTGSTEITNNCVLTNPSCFPSTCAITYNPTSQDQAWLKDALSCGYSCIGGYSGGDCNTEPAKKGAMLNPGTNCKDILENGGSIGNGVYRIVLSGSVTQIYCDMITDGGGWNLIYANNTESMVNFMNHRKPNVNVSLPLSLDTYSNGVSKKIYTSSKPNEIMFSCTGAYGSDRAVISDSTFITKYWNEIENGASSAGSNYSMNSGNMNGIEVSSASVNGKAFTGSLSSRDYQAMGIKYGSRNTTFFSWDLASFMWGYSEWMNETKHNYCNSYTSDASLSGGKWWIFVK